MRICKNSEILFNSFVRYVNVNKLNIANRTEVIQVVMQINKTKMD
jgi:hypothetical protein